MWLRLGEFLWGVGEGEFGIINDGVKVVYD